jgi:hypothetical protein
MGTEDGETETVRSSDVQEDELEEELQQELVQFTQTEVEGLRTCGFLQLRVGSLCTSSLSRGSSGALFALSHPRVCVYSMNDSRS